MSFLKTWFSFVVLVGFSFSSEEVFTGKAFDQKGNHLFTEKYIVKKDQDKVKSVATSFYSPNNELIASLDSLFGEESFLPQVIFKNESKFLRYGTNFLENSIELFKSTKKRPGASKVVTLQDNMVAGHGFYFYILSQVDKLLKGEKKTMVFLQPNKLTSYTFSIKAKTQSENSDLVDVTLSLNNKLLRALVSDIKLTIERSTSRIISYEGVSGFFPCESPNSKIVIKYTYETIPK